MNLEEALVELDKLNWGVIAHRLLAEEGIDIEPGAVRELARAEIARAWGETP